METTINHPRKATPANVAIDQWRSWPFASTCLRFAIVCVPVTVATVLGLMAGILIDGGSVAAAIARVVVAGVISLVSFVALERLARRFLPLAMLLRLSLVFPDHAPSRFTVALRSTSVKKLQQWAGTTQRDGGSADLVEKVVTLASALNTHDRRTRGHSDRSRATAELIAVEMGLSDAEINEVRWGAFLHDIGKILVPASLLNKPGKPTPAEWETLKRHPVDGGNLVEPLRELLGSGVEAVRGHHENFDGSGYPDGMAGVEIPLAARIVSVADSFEVMTAVRSYKKPMTASDARKELVRLSGTQFDPSVVRALFNVSLGKVHWSLGFAAWMADIPLLSFAPRVAAQAATLMTAPTMSVGTLSGVAALSLGTMVASGGVAGSPPVVSHPATVLTSASPATLFAPAPPPARDLQNVRPASGSANAAVSPPTTGVSVVTATPAVVGQPAPALLQSATSAAGGVTGSPAPRAPTAASPQPASSSDASTSPEPGLPASLPSPSQSSPPQPPEKRSAPTASPPPGSPEADKPGKAH